MEKPHPALVDKVLSDWHKDENEWLKTSLKKSVFDMLYKKRGFHVFARYLNSDVFTKVYLSPSSTVAHLKMILSKKNPT